MDKIISFCKRKYFEEWLSLFLLIGGFISIFSNGDLITSWSHIILTFLLGGIATIRRELDKLNTKIDTLTKDYRYEAL